MNDADRVFVAMVIATVSSPGPGVLMTLDNAIAAGWRAAMQGVLGLALGAALMAGLSSAGIGLVLHSSPAIFPVLKYCGVGYLFYLAYKTWHRAPPRAGAPAAGMQGSRLVRGALLQTSNPKSLLFFLSVLPQVAGSGRAADGQTMGLMLAIATYCVALILIHALYAGLAARARTWLSRPGTARLLSRLSALVFLAFGVAMLTLKL